MTNKHLTLVNPLGAMLEHYARQAASVLEMLGWDVRTLSVLEPSVSGSGRAAWLRSTYALVRRARQQRPSGRVVMLWPPIGLWDRVLLRLFAPRISALVVHDPQPLVKAVGYDRLALAASRLGSQVPVIVHSEQALRSIQSLGVKNVLLAVLPVMMSAPEQAPHDNPRHIIVLGQFKPDRDIALLTALGVALTGEYELSIHGRGWPEVEGWDVDSRFLEEVEVDDLLTSGAILLIPYTRFFQSGVAVRALECGARVVGSKDSSLSVVLGARPSLLADSSDPQAFIAAIRYASTLDAADTRELLDVYRDKVRQDWTLLSDVLSRPRLSSS